MKKGIKSTARKNFILPLLAALLITLLASPGAFAKDSAPETEPWQFGVSIYGWLPDISGQTVFTPGGSSGEFEVGIDQILDNLVFTLMGTLDVRKGSFGFLTDVIYMGVGNSKTGVREGTIGGNEIPVNATASVNLDLVSWVCTFAGYYRIIEKPEMALDFVAGARYLDVDQTVDWSLTGTVDSIPVGDRTGSVRAGLDNWDAVFGVRGKYAFGDSKAWFVPYYLDMGLGNSDLTWQGTLGLGYAFSWGELVGAWRYLYYDLPSDSAIQDMNFSGPAIGAVFRW